VKLLAKKGCLLGFEKVKSNFITFGPSLENYFWLLLEKSTIVPPLPMAKMDKTLPTSVNLDRIDCCW